MNVRYTTPPRIEWKEWSGSRWIGRTLSVTPRNLERYGIAPPRSQKDVKRWHVNRLVNALKQSLELEAENVGKEGIRLSAMIEIFLSNFRGSPGNRQRKERVFLRACESPAGTGCRTSDISLLTFLGDQDLACVAGEDILRYRNFLEDLGYSAMSVRGYLVDVRTLFNYAVRHGYLEKSPADVLALPASEPSEEIRFLTENQVSRLLEIAGDPLGYDPLLWKRLPRESGGRRHFKPAPANSVLSLVLPGFLFLGLRRSELVRLKWSDIDLQRRVAIIRGARKNPSKREKKRAVPIPPQLFGYLAGKPKESEFVFTNSAGRPFNKDSLNSALRRFRKTYGKALGFGFDFQTLRRTYGSLLYQAGYSLHQVGEFLGHSDFTTTRKWYVGLRAEDQLEKVEAAFAGIPFSGKAAAS